MNIPTNYIETLSEKMNNLAASYEAQGMSPEEATIQCIKDLKALSK